MAKPKQQSDQITDPKFQQVIQHFLKTPHKPHKAAVKASKKKGDKPLE